MCPQDQAWTQKSSVQTQTDNANAQIKIRPAVIYQAIEPQIKPSQIPILGKRGRGRPRKYPLLVPQSQIPEQRLLPFLVKKEARPYF